MLAKPNVILISADSLRANHLGCYGYALPTSPNMDALACQGVLFEKVFAAGIPTQPSHTTIFTGQHPIRHGVVAHGGKAKLSRGTPFLPEMLLENGYTTCAVDTLFRERIWFGRGWEYIIDPSLHHLFYASVTQEELNDRAIQWIKTASKTPFFMFIHYWDAHYPYVPPARMRGMFYKGGNPTDPDNHQLDEWWDHPVGEMARATWLRTPGGLITDPNYVTALYDREIRYLDEGIAALTDALDRSGLAENTMLVVLADHGESLTDHRICYDHYGLYDCVVNVPMIVRWPAGNLKAGSRFAPFRQLSDVAPTILEAAGAQLPEELDGASFLPQLTGREEPAGYERVMGLESTWQSKYYLRDSRYKFILARVPDLLGNPDRELYDLQSDPGENHNIAADQPELASGMEAELEALIAAKMETAGRTEDPVRVEGPVAAEIWEQTWRMNEMANRSVSQAALLVSTLVLLLVWLCVPAEATPPSQCGTAKLPCPPVVTVDSTLPNLFYGAVPPNGPNGPVLVFVHGLSGNYQNWLEYPNCAGGCASAGIPGNTMYDLAYQAGYRTAFMSLSADNTANNASIQTNAAMLQTMFPIILNHYGVSKVYFVCHSKGGLDLQAAIANPQWIGIANMVMNLGTPNQGDALASWIYLPANQALGQELGLLTPAVQSLEVTSVLQLRAQWDPIFENAQIPFYTLSGNTYACGNGNTGCSTAITGPILTSITGGTSAPKNDGLVDHPETLLPSTYAMELGIMSVDHPQLRLGVNAFSYVNGQVMAHDNEQPGFSRIATGGFGDEHNTWAWSSAWFKGNLYVGTGREVYCVSQASALIQTGLPLYPPQIGDCTPDYHYLPLQAEIWQYNPQTGQWLLVFQSPNSLTTTDNNGKAVATARDIGFRGLTVVNEPGGVQALYAGGVTSGAIFTPAGAPGTWPPPRVLRSVDGIHWAPLPQDPGTFLGDLTLSGTSQYPIYSIRSAAQLNGILFLQVGDFPGVGRVISSLPGANPSGGNNNYQWASPAADQLPIWILESFNNFMYAGTGNPLSDGTYQYGVSKTNGTGTAPYTWTPVIAQGGYATNLVADYAMSMEIFSTSDCPGVGCLYVGTDAPNEMVRIHPDDNWDLVVGDPRKVPAGQPSAGIKAPLSGIGQFFENGFTGHFWKMGVGGQGLYMGTWDWSADSYQQPPFGSLWSQEFGTDVWRTNDGTHWFMVSKIGLGDGLNTGGRSFASTPFGLYMGTARSVGGAQVFLLDNSQVDFNHDGVIDRNDLNLLSARLNTKARPNDPMDLDQDGQITSADVRLLATQCTYAGCAAPPNPPSSVTLASPVLSSVPGTLGGPVSLTWNAVAGAKDYLVYRIALSASDTVPPPGVNGVNLDQLASACKTSPAARLDVCSVLRLTQSPNTAPLYGYPSAPLLLTRVTTPAYSENSLSDLQSLYFVRTEDASGNLSVPSNIVGGPSLALQ